MMKRYILFALLGMCLMGCSDDEKVTLIELATPQLTITDVTSNSLAFEWTGVDGARQYGYRVAGPDGGDIVAGVTTSRRCECNDLTPFTAYTISVSAFPVEHGTALASETTQEVSTLFYDIVEDCATAYVSYLNANMTMVTNRGTINEDRSYEGYEPNTYGIFTITKFCGRNGHDLVFSVNRMGITIIGAEHDEHGCAIVSTGQSASLGFDKIYIDEISAVFNGPGRTLTFTAHNNGTGSKYKESNHETITWQ